MHVSVLKALCLILLGVLLGGGALAAADSLLTSKDIKDGAIQNRDIREGVISLNRLTEGVQDLIESAGPAGVAALSSHTRYLIRLLDDEEF